MSAHISTSTTPDDAIPSSGSLAHGAARSLAAALKSRVTVTDISRIPAGASRQTWALTAEINGQPRDLILRLDLPGSRADSSLTLEASLMNAAHRAGVASPEVIAVGARLDGHGGEYVIMSRVDGESIPRKLLRDDRFGVARGRLAGQLGHALARVHSIDITQFPELSADDQLALWTTELDRIERPLPTFEYALSWLTAHRPASAGRCLVHGDFRLGNFLVDQEGLSAVLDWELAHLGDPLEDLGWMCVKAWRFGGDAPVGGFGSLDDFIGAYESHSEIAVDRDALFWWQVFGTLRWGVICMNQTERHRGGAARSVELAAIGRRVSENEWELLELLR